MEKKTYYCDVCKKETSERKDLEQISISNGGETGGYSTYNRFELYKKYDMCQSCQEKIGLYFPEKLKPEEIKSVQDRLFDIVCEIVSMNLPNN